MPQIDTPPPLRAPTDSDDRLETGMRETEVATAVEIDHEAKARHEEERRQREGRAETETPPPARPVGDDTDALETAARDRVEPNVSDASDPVAPPPAQAAALEAPKEPAKPPLSTAPASLPPPKTEGLPASGPTPACPQCEAPMAWVEEHLRFYCKSCRMYF